MAPLMQDYKFLITAKKLDNFTINTFTFSYPIFHARVNHFPNIWAIHAKIGVRKYKISASPSNKSLNGAGSLSCRPVTCTVYKIINTANWSLKQKNIDIEIYLSIYFSFYSFVYFLITVLYFSTSDWGGHWGLGVGWVRNLRPKRGKGQARAGLTSDTSLSSLPFDGNAFSVRSRLCFDSKILLNTIVYNTVSYWFFSTVGWGGARGAWDPPIILTGTFNLVGGHALHAAIRFNVFISVR